MRTVGLDPGFTLSRRDSTFVPFMVQIPLVRTKRIHRMESPRVIAHCCEVNRPKLPGAKALSLYLSDSKEKTVITGFSWTVMSARTTDDKQIKTGYQTGRLQKMKFFTETSCGTRSADGTNSTFSNTTGSTTEGSCGAAGAVTHPAGMGFGFHVPVKSGSGPVCSPVVYFQSARVVRSAREKGTSALWD